MLPDVTALSLELLSHDPNFADDEDGDEEMDVDEYEDGDGDDSEARGTSISPPHRICTLFLKTSNRCIEKQMYLYGLASDYDELFNS